MPGAAMYIVENVGDAQDNYFTVNPQMTYFTSVFRKHTKFSIQTIKEGLDVKTLKGDGDTKIIYKIPRHGDLLKSMYLSITLPDIYSGKYAGNNSYQFKWIRNLGQYMIKDMELLLGGTSIQKITGEYLDISKELHCTPEQKDAINVCTGNMPELYDPARGPGQVEMNSSSNFYVPVYPDSVSNTTANGVYGDIDGSYSAGGSIVNLTESDFSDVLPSIHGRKLKIPLDFFFQKNTGLAIPLIALRGMELELRITLRPVQELYTILNNTGADANARQRGKDTVNITKFTTDTTTTNTSELLDVNTEIEMNYIFLSMNERRRFTTEVNRYLIEKVRKIEINNVNLTTNRSRSIEFTSDNHVKQLIFVPKRSDAKDVNEWDNFTNWINKDIPPYSFLGKFGESMYNNVKNEYCYPNLHIGGSTLPSKSLMKKDIIDELEIYVDNNSLFEKQDGVYYQKQVPLEYHSSNPKDGVYVYSFALMPKEHQPTGSIGMAGHRIRCDFTFQELSGAFPANTDYTFEMDIYVVEYNILKIMNGSGSFEFN